MQNSRRNFLRQVGIGASAALVSPIFQFCQPNKVSHSPLHNLGLQLYTLRDLLKEDPIKTIETVAKIGYKHVETFGLDPVSSSYWGMSATDFKKLLDDNDLKSYSGHYDLANYISRHQPSNDGVEHLIEVAHQLGQSYIVAPMGLREEIATLEVADYQYAAEQLNKAGEMAQKAGIRVAYHNHFWEFRGFANGTRGLDILLAFTEPSLVDFELDLFWTEKAGFSPQSYFEKYPNRFPIWHLKDIDKRYAEPIVGEAYDKLPMEDIMPEIRYTEVGSGAINFPNIVAYAEKAGLKYALVEQDDIYIPNKFESIKKSFDYVQKNLTKQKVV